jgi:hypothetical protein
LNGWTSKNSNKLSKTSKGNYKVFQYPHKYRDSI